MGPLRFSAKVGFSDRPSLACLKTLRHPASPASTRGCSTSSSDARRSQTGEEHQQHRKSAKQRQKPKYCSWAIPQLFSSSPRRRGSSSAELEVRMRTVKPENPTVKTIFGHPRIFLITPKRYARHSLTACVPTKTHGTHGIYGHAAKSKADAVGKTSGRACCHLSGLCVGKALPRSPDEIR